MMSEKPKGGTGLSGMSSKQKMTAVVFVIIVIIVIWQAMGLLGGRSHHTPTPASTPVTAVSPNMAGKGSESLSAVPPPPTTTSIPSSTAAPVAAPPQISETIVPKEAEFFKLQQDAQQKYITSLNELQTLRIQKEIEETHQAIATAKLATVSAEKNIADLLTKPAIPSLAPSAYGSGLVTPVQSGQPIVSNAPMQSLEGEPQYVVISVAMQFNTWSAVVGYQGKLYQVTVGSILAPDQSEVVSINNNGVVLERGNKRKKITIVPSI